MKLRTTISLSALACLSIASQGKSSPSAPPTFLSANIPRQQELNNLVTWILNDAHTHGHPPDQTRLQFHIPSIDIFAPSGSLIYHAPDPDSAVKVLAALPVLPPVTSGPLTLDEALDVVPDFQAKKDAIKQSKRYIIYAVTDSVGPCKHCGPQDMEIAELKKNVSLSNYSILQVTLTK